MRRNFRSTFFLNVAVFVLLLGYSYYSVYSSAQIPYYTDLYNYMQHYYGGGDLALLSSPAYLFFSQLFLYVGLDFNAFRFFLFFIFYYSIFISLDKLNGNAFIVLCFLVACFFFPSYQSLSEYILKQGLGFSFLLILGFYFFGMSFQKRVALILFSVLFHISFIFYLLPMFLLLLFKGVRPVLYFWIFSAISYLFSIPVQLGGYLPILDFISSEERFSGFSSDTSDSEYVLGFKLSFLALSVLPVALAFLLFLLKRQQNQCSIYLFSMYLWSNALGFWLSGFQYYDRFMMFSWVIIPLYLISALTRQGLRFKIN